MGGGREDGVVQGQAHGSVRVRRTRIAGSLRFATAEGDPIYWSLFTYSQFIGPYIHTANSLVLFCIR